MKKFFCAVLAAGMILALSSCGAEKTAATAPPSTPTQTPVQTPAPTPTAPSDPPEELYRFDSLPVTEEGVKAFYAKEGYFTVHKITPYEGDFLVTVGHGEERAGLLFWIFGATGRQVQLNGMCDMLDVTIHGRGDVSVTDSGVSWSTPWKGMPRTERYQVLGDENGTVNAEFAQCVTGGEPTWLDPAEPLYIGWWSGDGPSTDTQRYEQLYDARMDVDGLSFAFIPSGDSFERFGGFFPACTTIPAFDTSFDPATRVFTLRLYKTSLRSGEGGNEALTGEMADWNEILDSYGVTYPYEFPAGSLGRDGHFITDAAIKTDGEDVLVTCRLTDAAYRFTVESGNLGGDTIPMFRLVFREHNNDLDGYGKG